MPRTRTAMRKIREVLRLKYACGLTNRQIAKTRAMGRTAVADYLRRTPPLTRTDPILLSRFDPCWIRYFVSDAAVGEHSVSLRGQVLEPPTAPAL